MQVISGLFHRFFGRALGRALLASVVLPASMAGPLAHQGGLPELSVLPLPPHARVAADSDSGRDTSGAFYFFSPSEGRHLARLTVEHPMGAKDLWRETWTTVSLPSLSGFRIRSAAIGGDHLFLGGERAGGGAVVRSFQIGIREEEGQEKMFLAGQVDYFPESADVAIRLLALDMKARILWLGYDSGRVESGPPFLFLHDRVLWADPAGYLPLPSETALSSGPPPLLVPRATHASGQPCFSCRFYLTSRMPSPEGEIRNEPVRSSGEVDSSMGLLPAGQGMGIFLGRIPTVCRIPESGQDAALFACHRITGRALPVAASWWGNRLAYLFPPGGIGKKMENRWVLAIVNPAILFSSIERLRSGDVFDFAGLLREKGILLALPAGAHPRFRTLSEDGRNLILFGRDHLYRIVPGS